MSGCAIWDAGYTRNGPVVRYSVSEKDKTPITYSVSIKTLRENIFAAPNYKGLRLKIEDAFRETGLFSEVIYGEKGGSDSYHAEFIFQQAGVTAEQSMGVGMLAGYSLLLIPAWEVFTFDGTAVLSIQDKPIYSISQAEEVRCLIWLPMTPVGLFMNAWTVWHFVEKGTVNALVNEIALKHKNSFLKESNDTLLEGK